MEKNDTRTLQEIVETEGYAAARKEADRRGVLWFVSAGAIRKQKGAKAPNEAAHHECGNTRGRPDHNKPNAVGSSWLTTLLP